MEEHLTTPAQLLVLAFWALLYASALSGRTFPYFG